MLVLFEHPLSPYAQKVKIALREKNIPFVAKLPEGIGTGASADTYSSASPRGEVPALVDDDFAIFDSTIILEYIEEKWPDPSLLPDSPRERARVRMIEDVMDTQVEAISWGLGELNFFRRAEGDLKTRIEEAARAQVEAFHHWLQGELADRPWFNGETFGWGDLSVIPFLNGLSGFGLLPAEGSSLRRWFDKVNLRDSVAETRAESSASIEGMRRVDAAVKAGLFKRQYRDHRLEWMMKSGGAQIVLDGLANNTIRFTGP